MKYVIFKGEAYGHEVILPVTFPKQLVHAEVAAGIQSRSRQEVKLVRPISAGFCEVRKNGTVHAYGESESLGIKSAEPDSEILTQFLTKGEDSGVSLMAYYKDITAKNPPLKEDDDANR